MPDNISTKDILETMRRQSMSPYDKVMSGVVDQTNKGTVRGAKAIKHGAEDIYERMKRAVTQGPYSSPTGEYDPRIGLLGPELMLPAFGRATGLGAVGGKIIPLKGDKLPSAYTEEYLSHVGSQLRAKAKKDPDRSVYHLNDAMSVEELHKIHDRLQTKLKDIRELESAVGNPDKLKEYTWNKAKEYREKRGPGSREQMDSISASFGYKSPVNQEEYIKSGQQTFEGYMQGIGGPQGRLKQLQEEAQELHKHINDTHKIIEANTRGDYELGAFGGKGKLGNNQIAENLDWLQKQKPVDVDWVKDWAKQADVPIRSIAGADTKYVKFDSPYNTPGVRPPQVRIPQDEGLHMGTKFQRSDAGNLFDTGIGNIKPTSNTAIKPAIWKQRESSLINEAGMSYSHPEALDAALKWRLHKAPPNNPLDPPGSGNWLIPEEMAPRFPAPKAPEVALTSIDPRQLKLLSSGFTPAQILEAMKAQEVK